jgi:hypothetical protein
MVAVNGSGRQRNGAVKRRDDGQAPALRAYPGFITTKVPHNLAPTSFAGFGLGLPTVYFPLFHSFFLLISTSRQLIEARIGLLLR